MVKLKKLLFIAYPCLKTGTGGCSYIVSLMKHLTSNAITIENKNNLTSLRNEININANTLFKEIIFISKKNRKRLIKTIKEHKIIHFNPFTLSEFIMSLLCLANGKKIVTTYHGNFYFTKKNKKTEISNVRRIIVYNLFLLTSNKVIFITKAQRELFRRYCIFKKKLYKKSVIINNFIEKKIITQEKRHNYKDLNILFVGYINQLKGAYDLLKLAKTVKIEKVFFNFLGSGSVRVKSNNVHLLGIMPHNKMIKSYDKSSVLILPSYTEVCPIAILEAMARGLVILVSDIPGMREIIKEGRNGYLFPPGDIEKMKKLIFYLKKNPKEIKRISKNNLKDIWKFTTEKQLPKYNKIYKEVLEENEKSTKK